MIYGIRISEKKEGVVSVDLPEILNEIQNGDKYYWSILFLSSIGKLGGEKSIPEFEDQILKAEKGVFLSWIALNELAKKFYQIYDLTLVGCINQDLVKRYEEDEKMHDCCDIVIEMIDSNFWEVFTKEKDLIDRLIKRFKNVAWLTKKEKG